MCLAVGPPQLREDTKMEKLSFACALLSGLGASACSAENAPADAHGCSVQLSPGADDQAAVQGALIDAKPGDTICLGAGRFHFTDQLSLGTERVTLRGVDRTVLDFAAQARGDNGIEITA